MRIYFVSASPPQIGQAIKEKLALDGIEYDGIVFKDQLQHLVRGKFRHLREQVGYKLTELLKAGRPSRRRRASCCSATTGNPIRSSTRCTPTSSPAASRAGELGGMLRAIGVDPPLIERGAAAGGRAAARATRWRASSSTSSAARRRRSFRVFGAAPGADASTTSRRRPACSRTAL